MIPDEYKAMIDLLIERSSQKKLRWKTTSDSQKFLVDIGLNAISVESFHEYQQDVDMIGIRLYNTTGDQIDWIASDERESDFIKLHSLYSAGRRSALNIDKTISEIMSSLS